MSDQTDSEPRAIGPRLLTVRDLLYPHEDSSWNASQETEKPLRHRYSLWRILFAIIVVGGGLVAAGFVVRNTINNRTATKAGFFAPYVDVTLPPQAQFQSPGSNVAKQTALGFVVASGSSCAPSWGGYYPVSGSDHALNMRRRIVQYTALGGTAIISFGGQTHTHLSMACSSVSQLANAYSSTIDTYHVYSLDFDTEGTALNSYGAQVRRAQALQRIGHRYQTLGHPLTIWLTIPVAPSGIQDNALSAVKILLEHHVKLAGVNFMTMDFGSNYSDMIVPVESALTAAHAQLSTLFATFGINQKPRTVWNEMGATVLVGQNNAAGEVFTTQDASTLVSFGRSQGLRRISMWSLNRDRSCGGVFSTNTGYSPSCSGVSQGNLQFSHIFSSGFAGEIVKASVGRSPLQAISGSTNPANAPYPIWQPGSSYPEYYKIVWGGEVYQAKWFNQGDQPSQSFQYPWQTPWLLLGPVLKTDHAPKIPTLPKGTYPAWQSTTPYPQGSMVLYQGLPFESKYFNQGASPQSAEIDPAGSPWSPLYSIPGEPPATAGTAPPAVQPPPS
ncbi:MAG: chitinase [Ferrimicrobium sp.]